MANKSRHLRLVSWAFPKILAAISSEEQTRELATLGLQAKNIRDYKGWGMQS